MQVEILSSKGDVQGTIELNELVFNVNTSNGAVYHGIRNELANKRQGTAKTKGRAEVAYSGRKPWKQKGTGRARAGTRRSPIWVGGGTIFGPQPRDYSYVLPRKMKRLAFKSVLTEKLKEGMITIVEDFDIPSLKTKDCCNLLKLYNPNMVRTVLIIAENNKNINRTARNIPWVRVYSYSRLLLKDIFYAKKILITRSAIEKLNGFFDGAALNNTVDKEQK